MTESKAIKKLKQHFEYLKHAWKPHSDYETMDAIGYAIQTLEKQMPEKQMPKKPIFSHNLSDTLSVFHCECGNTIKVSHDAGTMNNNNATNYCSKCGCKLDWSDKESEETKL